jgi:hypothetical protein
MRSVACSGATSNVKSLGSRVYIIYIYMYIYILYIYLQFVGTKFGAELVTPRGHAPGARWRSIERLFERRVKSTEALIGCVV